MPQGSVRTSQPLSNLAVQYKNDNYIAGQILKDIPVLHESDLYYIYANDFRLPETKRANKALANMVTWEASTSTYQVEEHALKDVVTQRDRENADKPFNLDADTTEFLTDKILLRQEYEAAKLLFTTTTWGNNATLTTATSFAFNTTTSAPIQYVLSATSKILLSSAKKANTVVMGWDVFAAAKENNNIYSRIQYVERSLITQDLLAALFDVDNLYVGTALIDSNKEGETASITSVWGADVLVAYFDPNPTIKKVTAAANFRVVSMGNPYTVKKWYDDGIDGDYIQVRTMFKPKAIATSCAYLFKTAALI